MAQQHSVRRRRVRRLIALSSLVVVGSGLVALEHTATGATTGRYANQHTTTTKRVTTTTKYRDNHHGRPRHCDDGHGKDNEKNKHCRPPSGGHHYDGHGDDDD